MTPAQNRKVKEVIHSAVFSPASALSSHSPEIYKINALYEKAA